MLNKKNIPIHLKHKPIYAINNYAAVDGNYKNNTDVVGLTIGKAQWSENKFIPSVKVWRRKDKRWLRTSEETTFTRALDMATMIIHVLDKHYNGQLFRSIQTIFGELKIEESTTNSASIGELEAFLIANRGDISTHVEMLDNALKAYKEHMATTAVKTNTQSP